MVRCAVRESRSRIARSLSPFPSPLLCLSFSRGIDRVSSFAGTASRTTIRFARDTTRGLEEEKRDARTRVEIRWRCEFPAAWIEPIKAPRISSRKKGGIRSTRRVRVVPVRSIARQSMESARFIVNGSIDSATEIGDRNLGAGSVLTSLSVTDSGKCISRFCYIFRRSLSRISRGIRREITRLDRHNRSTKECGVARSARKINLSTFSKDETIYR